MKISLNWVFDHIDGDVKLVDVAQLVTTFIKTTAEIEQWKKVVFSYDTCAPAQVIYFDSCGVTLFCPEWDEICWISLRPQVSVGQWYYIGKTFHGPVWATLASLGGTKDLLLPAIFHHSLTSDPNTYTAWRKHIEYQDYIIDIDNKSINHRPDLWGHRGIAREVAAMLDLPLIPLNDLTKKMSIQKGITSLQTSACTCFATLSVTNITAKPSDIHIAMRFSRIDARPIDMLVDATNYVMYDLGQPMHAFDTNALKKKNLIVRYAQDKEQLTLLDGQVISLTSNDVVVATELKAVSLAGIMGGAESGVTPSTHAIVLEAAHFDGTTIRKTAARYKKRTESSVRFEKNLDSYQITDAIERCLFLFDQHQIAYTTDGIIGIVGTHKPLHTITISHVFIEQYLGATIAFERVKKIMESIGFITEYSDGDYIITVPSYRSQEVTILQDIVEEVGRFVGYDSIHALLPTIQTMYVDNHATKRVRAIKALLSQGFSMRELYTYAFFDEQVLHELAWEPTDSVVIKNPVSENHTRLVTTLQPHLIKAVSENFVHNKQLRFYEWARVWHTQNNEIIECKVLSGIFFDQEKKIDFYEGKSFLMQLFQMFKLDVSWHPASRGSKQFPWLLEHQTATIMHNKTYVGTYGVINESALSSFATGTGLLFELDGDYLLAAQPVYKQFEQLPKYPVVIRDVSMFVPIAMMADELEKLVKKVDARIESVHLVDFFHKPEWKEHKSIALRVEMRDREKTLEHDEIETLWNAVITALVAQGATIR